MIDSTFPISVRVQSTPLIFFHNKKDFLFFFFTFAPSAIHRCGGVRSYGRDERTGRRSAWPFRNHTASKTASEAHSNPQPGDIVSASTKIAQAFSEPYAELRCPLSIRYLMGLFHTLAVRFRVACCCCALTCWGSSLGGVLRSRVGHETAVLYLIVWRGFGTSTRNDKNTVSTSLKR